MLTTFGALAPIFLLIALGVQELYEWARPEHVAHDPVLQHKAAYLNVPFFLVRAVLYFATWTFFAFHMPTTGKAAVARAFRPGE